MSSKSSHEARKEIDEIKLKTCPSCNNETLNTDEYDEYPPMYRIKDGIIERRIDCINCSQIFVHQYKKNRWVNRKKIKAIEW